MGLLLFTSFQGFLFSFFLPCTFLGFWEASQWIGSFFQPAPACESGDAVREGIGPFRDIQIPSHDSAALMAFGHPIVGVLIPPAFQRFGPEVVDQQEIHGRRPGEVAAAATGGHHSEYVHLGCGRRLILSFPILFNRLDILDLCFLSVL